VQFSIFSPALLKTLVVSVFKKLNSPHCVAINNSHYLHSPKSEENDDARNTKNAKVIGKGQYFLISSCIDSGPIPLRQQLTTKYLYLIGIIYYKLI